MAAAHFILYVADQSSARDFFARVLERAPSLDVPGMTEFELNGDGSVVLGLMPETGIAALLGDALPDTAPSGARPPRAELYVMVDDVARTHARALGSGATELSPPARRSWKHVVAYSLTEDGHVLAFASEG